MGVSRVQDLPCIGLMIHEECWRGCLLLSDLEMRITTTQVSLKLATKTKKTKKNKKTCKKSTWITPMPREYYTTKPQAQLINSWSTIMQHKEDLNLQQLRMNIQRFYITPRFLSNRCPKKTNQTCSLEWTPYH